MHQNFPVLFHWKYFVLTWEFSFKSHCLLLVMGEISSDPQINATYISLNLLTVSMQVFFLINERNNTQFSYLTSLDL